MWIYAKVGTHAQTRVRVVRKRKPPKVGECFKIYGPEKYSKQEGVYCHEIRDMGNYDLYVLERM